MRTPDSYTILIIEDDSEQSQPLIDMLKYRGYRVDHAFNGLDGIAKTVKLEPDLVIVDLLLFERGDDLDGFRVIEILRETEGISDVGILAWTGQYVKNIDQIRAFRVGADDYLVKETEFGILEARIEALLRRLS